VLRFYAALFAMVLAARLCHSGIVWAEEGYPLAAAREMLWAGKTLYADIWFDKPPLFPGFYLLFGALTGVPLRIAGALFVTLSAWSLGRFARSLWSEREERLAAALLAFFLTFGIPASVMVIGPDLMLIPIQAAAVLAAWRGNALAAGLLGGFGMLINGKMLFLLPACFVARPLWVAGLIAPQLIVLPVAREYWLEVWAWGAMYSRDTFVGDAFSEGLRRSLNWAGFHLTLCAGAVFALRGEPGKRRWLLWIALAAAAMIAGFRFFPRYYFLLLPPFVLLAARAAASRRWLLCLLLIPLIRFGPRYVTLAADLVQGRPHQWADLAMERDSREAARHVAGSVFVWGYRPEIYVMAKQPAATMFLDSQPLTGVLADRHLTSAVPTAPNLAAQNRAKLIQTNPDWIVDGLGPYNPKLAITEFVDLREWLSQYEAVHKTGGAVIYRRRP
jgi:4-amino-4-deoxy-L-arabinose transferase-like glycosyltransferase